MRRDSRVVRSHLPLTNTWQAKLEDNQNNASMWGKYLLRAVRDVTRYCLLASHFVGYERYAADVAGDRPSDVQCSTYYFSIECVLWI